MKKLIVLTLTILNISIIAFSQNTNYEVYALKLASARRPIPAKLVVMDVSDKDSLELVFMFWLVKGKNEKNILVDAGFLRDIEDAKNFDIVNYVRPDSLLLRVGVRATDITDIILTHPHWDHMDGIDLFPNAHIWIQKEDFNYFVGTAWQKNGNQGAFNKRDE